jgi:hypothetical protein
METMKEIEPVPTEKLNEMKTPSELLDIGLFVSF